MILERLSEAPERYPQQVDLDLASLADLSH